MLFIDFRDLSDGIIWNSAIESENIPNLKAIDCFGNIEISCNVRSVQSNFLLEGTITGEKKTACSLCGDDLVAKFSLPIKIFIEFDQDEGIRWQEDVDEYDNYVVLVNNRETSLSITSIIIEQVLLNCEYILGEDDEFKVEKCLCKENNNHNESKKSGENNIDSRWERLKKIKFD